MGLLLGSVSRLLELVGKTLTCKSVRVLWMHKLKYVGERMHLLNWQRFYRWMATCAYLIYYTLRHICCLDSIHCADDELSPSSSVDLEDINSECSSVYSFESDDIKTPLIESRHLQDVQNI
jgi:hypothetical protein